MAAERLVLFEGSFDGRVVGRLDPNEKRGNASGEKVVLDEGGQDGGESQTEVLPQTEGIVNTLAYRSVKRRDRRGSPGRGAPNDDWGDEDEL